MRYLGGKSRISKQIAEVINNAIFGQEEQNFDTNSTNYQSLPELGGGRRL